MQAHAAGLVATEKDAWEHVALDEGFWCPVGKLPMLSGMVSSPEGTAVTLATITIPCTSYL